MFLHTHIKENFSIRTLYTAFENEYESDYSWYGESHDFWELVIVTEGQIGATAGKDIYNLKKGQAILHEPGEFHNLWSEGGKKMKILIFSFAADFVPKHHSKLFELADISRPRKLLSDIYSAFEVSNGIEISSIKPRKFAEACLSVKALELFLLETFLSKNALEESRNFSLSAKNYSKVVRFLEINICKNFSVNEIANMCGIGEVNLKKIFSRYSGMGVIAFFNRVKISAAIQMLSDGKSIKFVSEQLGFLNQNYFSTVFKRITGKSPKNYK